MQTSACAGAVAALPALAGAAQVAQPANDAFGGFTVGIQSYSYRNFSRERAFEQIQKLGLRFVEEKSLGDKPQLLKIFALALK